MNLDRTPLLIEARGQTHRSRNRAFDMRRHRSGSKSTAKRKSKRAAASISRELDAPRIAMTMAGPGSFGPVSIGGIMRHS